MKINRTKQITIILSLSFALITTFSVQAQPLIAALFSNDPEPIVVAVNTTEATEAETMMLENWMNETNWSTDSSVIEEANSAPEVEDWMLESFENTEEEALVLEDWMTETFDVTTTTEENVVEEEIEVEDWMLDASQW